jgi:hypothetical protein
VNVVVNLRRRVERAAGHRNILVETMMIDRIRSGVRGRLRLL